MQYLKLNLPIPQIETILKALHKMPYEEVEGTIANIHAQAKAQLQPPESKQAVETSSGNV